MDKVKIGDNEYRLPIWCTTTKILSPFTETSPNMSERNFVTNEDITTALNELASLRAENEAFREDHHKHDEWMAWAQSYFNDNPDLCMWGSRLDVGIRETLIMRDQELAQLRQERDALKARVEELEKANVRMTGAIYDWYYAKRDYQSLHPGNHTSEEKSHTVERYLAAERVLRESVNHTTPGGDE